MNLARLLHFSKQPEEAAVAPRPVGERRPVPLPGAASGGAKDPKGDRTRTLDVVERCFGLPVAGATVRIRRASMLHRGGRKAEAWAMFNLLLTDPDLGGSGDVRPILHSEIYSRMGTCLEREACYHAAVTPTALAFATRAQFYAMQGRRSELARLREPGVFDRFITPLLIRARFQHVLDKLRVVVAHHLDSLPQLDINGLRAAIDDVLVSD